MKKLLLLVINFCFVAAMGQNLIAPITISLPANPPANTADWSTAMPPIMINAQSKLRNGQVPGEVIESRILVTIKNGGNKICGMYTQQTAPASNFNSVTKTWNGAALLSLLGQECVLKPGTYELCVQFYNLNPAAGNGVLGEACKSFTIADTKQQTYSPPQNILPANGKVFTKQEAGMPIMLRWIPVLPKPKADVQYKVRIVEILPGQNKTEALRNNTPIDIQEVKNQTQTSAKLAQRCNGCEYVWNVEASKKSQLGDIEMLGTSEATSFKVVDNAAPVVPACNCITITQGVTCHGTLNELPAYAIRDTIVNSCNKTITGWTITSSSGNINGPTSPQTLNTGTNYPAASMLVNSTTGMAILEYVFTFSDNTTCKVMKDLGLPNCNPPCGCGAWTNVAFQTTTATGAPQTITRNCNDTVTIRQNANFTINPAFNCTGNNCAVSYRYDVFFPNGTQLYNNVTASAISPVEMNQCNGVYKIVIKPTCGTQQCTPCTIYLKRDCPPACQCGTTGPLSVTINNDTVKTYQCVTAAPIIIPCNKPIQFNAVVNCVPNSNNSCKSVEYILKKGSTVISSGTAATLNYAYTFTQSGTYTLIVKGKCNGVQCDSCIYNLTVNCTTTCPCGTWKSTTATYTSQGGVYNNNPVDCGKGITVDCDKPVTINATYNCPAPCTSSVAYTVYTPSGSVLTTGASLPVTFTPGMAYIGMMYKVVLKPKCGTTFCDSCVIYVTPKCKPNCECGKWSSIVVGNNKYKCGEKIPWKCKVPFNFSSIYYCSPANDSACKANIKWEIKKGSIFINAGTGIGSVNGGFTPAANGMYTLTMNVDCNGKVCDSCTFFIVVDSCNECACAGWGPVKYMYIKNGVKQPWQSISCGNEKPIIAEQGQPYQFISQLNCKPLECKAEGSKVTVYNEAGNVIYSAEGKMLTDYYFKECGKYKVVFSGFCGGKKCEDCVLNVEVPCCKCKDEPSITLTEADGKPRKIKCGAQKYVKIECNKKYTLSASANCSGDECKSTVLISITGPGINLVNVAAPVTFTPTQTGYFTATIKPVCGTDTCKPCIITFVDTCVCKTCDTKIIDLKPAGAAVIKSNTTSGYDILSLNYNLITGPANILEVKAELVVFDMITGNECKVPDNKTEAAQGQFNQPGNSLATLFTDWQFPNPSGGNFREIKWVSTNAAGVNMTGGKALKLQVGIPDYTGNDCCTSSYKYCIRISVRDVDCVVCDKLFCVELKAGQYKVIQSK